MKNTMKNKHAQELGKLGGKSTSEKKRIAARLNGKKGGYRKHKKVIHSLKEKALD